MAGTERGLRRLLFLVIKLAGMPCGYYDPSARRVFLYVLYRIRNLVNLKSFCFPAPPLDAIYAPQIAREFRMGLPIIRISVGCPYRLLLRRARAVKNLRQAALVVGAFYEPQQFADHAFPWHLFCCNKRESFSEIIPELHSEDRAGSDARAVFSVRAVVKNKFHGVKILPHMQRLEGKY